MIAQIIVLSDLHAGDKLALCPPDGVSTLDGGVWKPTSVASLKLWEIWLQFTKEWIPHVTKGEPYILVANGDLINGKPHGTISNIDDAWHIQIEIARKIMSPLINAKQCKKYFQISGTEAHVGKTAEYEEILAKALGAEPDENGRSSRSELWLKIGRHKITRLCHFLHHIGTASSTASESNSVMKELSEMFTESGRWKETMPDCIVRSHRHRMIEVKIPSDNGYGIAFTTPCWQLKGPFAFKIAGARTTMPMLGGSLVRIDDSDLYTRHYVRTIKRQKAEVVT